jgi:hypothetical protein
MQAERVQEQVELAKANIEALRQRMLEADTKQRLRIQLEEWNVISPMVLAEFLGVRPQFIYGYIREGRIPSVRDNNTQKLYIEEDAALVFAHNYLERKAKRRPRADLDALLAE